jgi:hypothetical protein
MHILTTFKDFLNEQISYKLDGVIGTKTLQSAVDLFTTKMPRTGGVKETNKLIDILQK